MVFASDSSKPRDASSIQWALSKIRHSGWERAQTRNTSPTKACLLYTSTIKPPSGNLKARNSDLLAFTFGTTGSSTSGTWSLYFEGADVGLKKENIDALWIDPLNGDIYLSVTNAYNLGNGVSGDESAIFICDPGSLGATTTCTYRAYWDAAAAGLDANIRGIYIQR